MKLGFQIAAAILVAVIGAAVAASAILTAPLPPPSGRFGVASRPLALPTGGSTDATPITEIWYPTDQTDGPSAAAPTDAERPLPVLIYLPGWAGTSIENAVLVRDLVSHGFAVATLRYPTASEIAAQAVKGVTLRGEAAGEMDFTSSADFDRTLALAADKVRGRARDVTRLLDRLQGLNADSSTDFAGRLDLARIGAWGYSLGGAAAAQAAWLDRRIAAVANLDGWLFAEAATEGVRCPYLLVSDATPLPGPEELGSPDPATRFTALLDMQDYDRQTAGLARYGGLLLTIEGTTHASFSDAAAGPSLRRMIGVGAPDATRALAITAAYLRGFFQSTLRDEPSPLLSGESPAYPEARLRIFGHRDAGPS